MTARRSHWILATVGVLAGAALVVLARLEEPAPMDVALQNSTEDAPAVAGSSGTDASDAERAPNEVAAPIDPAKSRATSGSAHAVKAERWSAGVITGRVLGGPGATEPIAGIAVRAIAPRSTFAVPEHRTRTDAQGRYELRDLIAAHWEVEASLPALDLRGATSIELDEERQPSAVVDVLLPYERHVEVRLVDVRGDPITAEALGIDPLFLPLVCVGLARSCRESGAVIGPADMPLNRVLDKSAKGARTTFDVVIQGAGGECVHALFSDRVIAHRALSRDDVRVDIVLDPEDVARFLGACAVQVVEAAHGTPIAAGSASFRVAGTRLSRAFDADGVASLAGVPFGSLRVVVEVPGFVTRDVDVEIPRAAPLRVELLSARRIAGRLSIEGGRDPARLRPAVWRVFDATAKLGEPTLKLGRRASASEFAFEGLEPAIYVVAAVPDSVALLTAADVRDGKGSGAAWVDLTRGDATSIDLVLPAWLDPP